MLSASQLNRFFRAIRFRSSRQRGSSLIMALIAIAMIATLSASLLDRAASTFRFQSTMARIGDLKNIQQTILAEYDCPRTLGYTPATPLPMSCPEPAPVLRRRDGVEVIDPKTGQIGEWDVRTSCDALGLKIQVRFHEPQSLHRWFTGWQNLFPQDRHFCGEYFKSDQAPSCVDPKYPYPTARSEFGIACCRKVEASAAQNVELKCNPGEVLRNPGAACDFPGGQPWVTWGALKPVAGLVMLGNVANPSTIGDTWMAACRQALKPSPADTAQVHARGFCCPVLH